MEAIFAYIPVVHSGTLTFLRAHADADIFLLDSISGRTECVYLERDARALTPHEVAIELKAHGFPNVTVANHATLGMTLTKYKKVFVPNDEIATLFLKRYAPQVAYETVSPFLRWTQQLSTTEFVVPKERTISRDTFACEVLTELAEEAQKSADWWRQIGAAIVRDGQILIKTFNKHYPTTHSMEIDGDPRSNFDAGQGAGIYLSIHAEAWAIAEAARKGIATKGADIYVTTFPCPTCARSLVEAGFARVFYTKGYSLLDAEKILKDEGIEIILVE